MSNALSHVLDRTREVPGSTSSGVIEGTSLDHIKLGLLGPLALVDLNAWAGIRAEDGGWLVEEFIEGLSSVFTVLLKVSSHFERQFIVVGLAEGVDSRGVEVPDSPDRDSYNKGEDQQEDSPATVTGSDHALSAVDNETTTASIE